MKVDNPIPNSTSPAGELLAPTQEDGKLLRSRIKDARAGRSSYQRMKKSDADSSAGRAQVQDMVDGGLPYNQSELDLNGLGEICNVNWGQGKQFLSMAVSPYIDLVDSVDVMITTPTSFGDAQARLEWESIMAEEFTRMLRGWREFFPRYMYLIHQFLLHGVAVVFREDEIDWRWQVAPLGDFLIPRNTRASDEELEIGCTVRSVPPHELFMRIEDPELAKEMGWNVEAVREAILNAAQAGTKGSANMENWEDVQREYKNNDLGSSTASAAAVKLVYMWVRELNGKVSQYVFLESDEKDSKEFLYECREKYDDISQVMTSFTYGIGTNGYFHSIRGLASEIFPVVQALNRLRNRFFDGLMTSSMLMIEPESEDAMQDLSLVHFGPFMVKPPNVKVIQKDQPNFSQSLLPGISDLSTLLQQLGGTYANEAVFNSERDRTRYEVKAQMESLANLSLSNLSLFYVPWERHLRESLRRAVREDYFPEDPGGKEVADFRERCQQRGVPIEAILGVDVRRARAVRAIGSGSAAARMAVMERIYGLAQNFDPQGRQQVFRDLTRTIGGVEAADRYAPAPENLRPPMEQEIATMENTLLHMGGNIATVRPNTLHRVHFDGHMPEAESLIQSLDQGAQVDQVMPALNAFYSHITGHAEYLQSEPDYMQIKKRVQEMEGIIYNGNKHLKKLGQEAAEAQAEAQAQGQSPDGTPANPNALPDTLQRQLVESSTRLRMAEEKHQQDMKIRADKAQQDMAIKDVESAAKLARSRFDP